MELANQLYQLRSVASLGQAPVESVQRMSTPAENVRVIESPVLKEDNAENSHESDSDHSGDRYADLYKTASLSLQSVAEEMNSNSYSCDDMTGDVIRSLLANDNKSKSDGTGGSYSTVTLGESM